MRRDPTDRILDLALEEVLGGAKPPDLSRRILAATRRPRVLRGRRPRVAAVAAAVLAAVGLALFALWPDAESPPPGPEPVARLSGGRVLVGGAGKRFELETGDVVTGDNGTVTFPSGAVLAFEGDALVRIDGPDAAELLAGTLRVRGAMTVRTHLGVVVTGDGADARVELPAADFAARLHGWLRGDAPRPAQLSVSASSGSVAVDGAVVREGTVRIRPPGETEDPDKAAPPDDSGKDDEPEPPPPLTEEETKLLDGMLRTAFPDLSAFEDDARKKMEIEAGFAREQLRRFLATRPPAWEHVRPWVLALPRAEHRAAVVDLLIHDPDPAGRDVALAEARDHAVDIGGETLLVLAEAGDASARAELVRRLRARPDDLDLVPAAVSLALRGEAQGRATLRWFLEASRQTANYPQLYVAAAAGLARLGDDVHWNRVPGFVRRTVNRYLDATSLGNARRLVACFSYFRDALARRTPADVADLDAVLSRRADAEKLKTAADIRKRLGELLD
jgi:hypothetical protein